MSRPSWLPSLIVREHGELESDYLTRVYETFSADFLDTRPSFQGRPLRLRYFMEGGVAAPNGKEATFWHLISEGEVETERRIDILRCERIGWVRAMLDHFEEGGAEVRVWRQIRQGKTNFGIALPTLSTYCS